MLSFMEWLGYVFLFLAVPALWLPAMKLWKLFAFVSVFAGLLGQSISPGALGIVAVLIVSLRQGETKTGLLQLVWNVVAFVLLAGLAAHAVPFFHNLPVLTDVRISADGRPFTMYLNLDKALAGLLVLGLSSGLLADGRNWLQALRQAAVPGLLFGLCLLLLACFFGKVQFDPKLPGETPLWLVNNLFIVCMAEEALFRGFFQRRLALHLAHFRYGWLGALLFSSLLFGFAHYAGGLVYSIWGLAAGLFYGWMYQRTGRIEASISAHFLLNLLHFFFFTYPVLA